MKTVYPIIYNNGGSWAEDVWEKVVLVAENEETANQIIRDLNDMERATTKEKMNFWNEKYGRITGIIMAEPYPTSGNSFADTPYFRMGKPINLI